MCRVVWVVLTVVLLPAPLSAQGSRADYERAAGLRQRFAGKVFRDRVQPHWDADGNGFWYRIDLAAGVREYVRVDAVRGMRAPAFDHDRLAAALTKAAGRPIESRRLPIDHLAFGKGPSFHLGALGKRWECTLPGYTLRELGKDEGGPEAPPTLATPRPTRSTGPETSLTFLNQTRDLVELFWIDPDGAERSYGRLAPGQEHRQHTYAGHVWLVRDARGRALAIFEAAAGATRAILDNTRRQPVRELAPRRLRPPAGDSPDGTWTAFVKEHNVWLRERPAGKETALTTDGTAEHAYTGTFYWSPDSRRLVALRRQEVATRRIPLIESSPRDQLQPRLHDLAYRKPGDPLPITRPRLFDLARRQEVPIDTALFDNPWDLSEYRWEPDSTRFTFLVNQRGHQVLRIVGVDAATGQAAALVDERSKTFIDYAHKRFTHYLDDTGELLWMSERDGWNHLYLYDLTKGVVKNPVTRGPWVVRGVDRVDPVQRQVWFRAGGIHPGQDPYYLHHARVNFDGTGLTLLTQGNGTHTLEYSPDGRFFLDSYSRVDAPPVTELRRTADGGLACLLEQADSSALESAGWRAPRPFVARGRDDTTDIHGVLYFPTTFDPSRRYPVIEQIYAGPQGAYVPKSFQAFHGPQALAELGFVVVQIDGMGTSYRSKAFHDVCWKNLGDAGFPDRIRWLKAAAREYPCLDLGRVGIYGGSAGGQNALRALLAHGDFYTVAVADCGCHDNRMDKIWWNELWMGWPIGPHYAEQSNVTQAHKLRGKLLLTVGELDRNVDPASTMQVVNALIRADRDFELIVFPGAGHGAGSSPYGIRRRNDFFVRHLLGVEPRSQP